jgi:hypothetical protein
MKKSIYFLMMFVGLAFTSCEPMEDIHDQVDAELNAKSIQGVADYTLTDDDYDALDLRYGNFSNIDDAKEMIPGLLSNLYPVWGKGSLANVTFKLYAPKQDEKSLIVYEVTRDDYDQYGDDDFASFDREWQVMDLIEDKFADAENRTLVSLTYDYYDGGLSEVNNGFLLLNGDWVMIPGISDDEYKAMGESYPNFSSHDEAEAKLPIFLNDAMKFSNPKKGDFTSLMYKLYITDEDDVDQDGKTEDKTTYSFVKYFMFDGANWTVYNNVAVESLQFGHDGATWVPDNTIKYTFNKPSDYEMIGNAFLNAYPGPGDNVAFFKSFDRRSSSENYWNDAMLLEAMNLLLDNLDPSAEEGQKYEVTFDTYVGAPATETLFVVKDGGVWVYQE